MTLNDLVAAYVAGRITEEVFSKLLKEAKRTEFVESVTETVEDYVEDFMDFFDW